MSLCVDDCQPKAGLPQEAVESIRTDPAKTRLVGRKTRLRDPRRGGQFALAEVGQPAGTREVAARIECCQPALVVPAHINLLNLVHPTGRSLAVHPVVASVLPRPLTQPARPVAWPRVAPALRP